MIRNHLLDPESSGNSGKGSFQPYGAAAGKNASDDPWFDSGSDMNNSSNARSYPNFSAGYSASQSSASGMIPPPVGLDEDYDNEPPLLEELGIRFDHIWAKTQAVINPTKQLSEHILDDADIAGPLCFCLLLGSCLLLSGKVHFGYIYGFSLFGCIGMCMILNLLHPSGIDFVRTCSVLGYSLIPVIGLAGLAILVNLKGGLGTIFAAVAIGWSTFAAARMIHAKLDLTELYWLVVYPIALLYSCFVLITIF